MSFRNQGVNIHFTLKHTQGKREKETLGAQMSQYESYNLLDFANNLNNQSANHSSTHIILVLRLIWFGSWVPIKMHMKWIIYFGLLINIILVYFWNEFIFNNSIYTSKLLLTANELFLPCIVWKVHMWKLFRISLFKSECHSYCQNQPEESIITKLMNYERERKTRHGLRLLCCH